MAELESKFRIKAQSSGFKELTAAADRLAQAFRRVGQAGLEMGDRTQQGARRIGKALGGVGGGGPATGGSGNDGGGGGGGGRPGATISTSTDAGRRVGHGGGGPGGGSAGGPGGGGSGGGPLQRGFAPGADRIAGSFTQGLLQGAVPESFIERGPGAYRQAAGVLAGRTARRTLGAATDFALSAAQGPNAIASALGGIPLVGGLLANGLGAGIQAARGEEQAQSAFAGLMPYVGQGSGAFTGRMSAERSRLGRLGMRYAGMSNNQSLAAFAQAAAQSGGTTAGYGDERLARALQAQQGYGVDLGTSLRLLRGEDTGQTRGRNSANTLGEALGAAQGLGLEGAEVGQYLRRMAADLEEVNRTGIKFSAAGQGDLERAMARSIAGAAPERAVQLGQSLNTGINQLAQGGPQNAGQAMLLQAAGFDAEDPRSYARAMRALEDPTRRANIVGRATRLMRRSTRGYSVDEQAESYRQFMAELNTNISHTEAYDAIRTGAIDRDPTGVAQNLGRSGAMSDAQLTTQAMANVPLSVQRSAAMSNIDTRVGTQNLTAVQTADANAKAFTTSVQGAGTMFLNAANSIADLGRQLANFGMANTGESGAATSFR